PERAWVDMPGYGERFFLLRLGGRPETVPTLDRKAARHHSAGHPDPSPDASFTHRIFAFRSDMSAIRPLRRLMSSVGLTARPEKICEPRRGVSFPRTDCALCAWDWRTANLCKMEHTLTDQSSYVAVVEYDNRVDAMCLMARRHSMMFLLLSMNGAPWRKVHGIAIHRARNAGT